MFDTAWRQLRHGWSMATGRPVRVADVQALVRHLRSTIAEFGHLDTAELSQAMGTAMDPADRRALDERRWRAVVRTAYRNTIYYRDLIDRLGLRPDELTLD